jgi:hypothetical protein
MMTRGETSSSGTFIDSPRENRLRGRFSLRQLQFGSEVRLMRRFPRFCFVFPKILVRRIPNPEVLRRFSRNRFPISWYDWGGIKRISGLRLVRV